MYKSLIASSLLANSFELTESRNGNFIRSGLTLNRIRQGWQIPNIFPEPGMPKIFLYKSRTSTSSRRRNCTNNNVPGEKIIDIDTLSIYIIRKVVSSTGLFIRKVETLLVLRISQVTKRVDTLLT